METKDYTKGMEKSVIERLVFGLIDCRVRLEELWEERETMQNHNGILKDHYPYRSDEEIEFESLYYIDQQIFEHQQCWNDGIEIIEKSGLNQYSTIRFIHSAAEEIIKNKVY